MLGLMLVVTMLANYLATQLPAQMQVYDVNHGVTVLNQVARLASAIEDVASLGAVGATISQPITLGSLAAPPFAPSDGASIGPGAQGSQLAVSYTVNGSSIYAPPTVGPAGGTVKGASCSTHTTTVLTCSSTTAKVVWNFTSSATTSISVTTSGGPYYVNTSASNSTLAITASSAAPMTMLVAGSNDTITLTISGTSTVLHLIIVGSHDAVEFASSSSWSSSTLTILAVGNHNAISSGSLSATNSKLSATFFGSNDSVSLGSVTATNSYFNVYLNGFTPGSPVSICPVDNLAYTTGSVAVTTHSGGTYNVTYNDTSVSTGTAPSPWTGVFGTAVVACPFYAPASIPETSSGAVGASLAVTLKNTYTPGGVIAFDQGAVVYAQRNGVPLMFSPPGITLNQGNLSVWLPEFVGGIGTEVGTGTAVLSVRLVSVLDLKLPTANLTLSGATSIVVTTPFAQAWSSYLNAQSAFAGDAVCVPKTSTACSGAFSLNGPLGTVYLNVTATGLQLQVATYSVSMS